MHCYIKDKWAIFFFDFMVLMKMFGKFYAGVSCQNTSSTNDSLFRHSLSGTGNGTWNLTKIMSTLSHCNWSGTWNLTRTTLSFNVETTVSSPLSSTVSC